METAGEVNRLGGQPTDELRAEVRGGFVYDYEHGFDDPGDKNAWFGAIIGTGQRIMEVGCATGYVGEYLTHHRACEVVGIELIEGAALKAQGRACYESVIVGDIQDSRTLGSLPDGSFDFVLFGDVLEHLVDPEIALRSTARLLRDGGHVLVCVPNIVHWSMRFRILLGRFDYTATGTLDRTHLRFYTPTTVRHMVEGADFEVERVSGVVWLPSLVRKQPNGVRLALERVASRISPSLFWGQVLLQIRPRVSLR